MNKVEHERALKATNAAVDRILAKGTDDVFKPPIFSQSIESSVLAENGQEFRQEAVRQTIHFLKTADLQKARIGLTRRGLVTKDQNTFRQVAWLDPFDAVKYLSLTILLAESIEPARLPKADGIVHSHRCLLDGGPLFDEAYGYDSFRAKSSELSRARIGQWKVVTDIANFFDRIGNHTLENHLKDIGCEEKYVNLIREMLFFWAGDRRSFGIPVGSDASRILSEAVLLDVDRKLRDEGIIFVRYVDDFRVFADTRAKALKAVEVLTALLAEEGLSLNSRKTDIFEIVEPDEVAQLANKFAGGEHEAINVDEKIEVRRAIRVSGRSAISRFYREPGKEALQKIKAIPKDKIFSLISETTDDSFEVQVKLIAKFFVYADQDVNILSELIKRKITSIFYISDALVKESHNFSLEKCEEIKQAIFGSTEWLDCAYPLQVPVLRISSHASFREPKFVRSIVDGHLQSDCMVFYREAISLGYPCLDRARLRRLAIDVFGNVPSFVQRAIYCAVKRHADLSDDEKRPLLRNMKQHADDWFVQRI